MIITMVVAQRCRTNETGILDGRKGRKGRICTEEVGGEGDGDGGAVTIATTLSAHCGG